MTDIQPQAGEIVKQYVHLTGREARVQVYEYALFGFIRAGFTTEEFVLVVKFLVSENKKNNFQYSLALRNLLNDHPRFMDLLGEAKAKARSTPPKPTPAAQTLAAWRGCDQVVNNGNRRHVSEVFEAMRKATNQ